MQRQCNFTSYNNTGIMTLVGGRDGGYPTNRASVGQPAYEV